jgi:hypothetical protein
VVVLARGHVFDSALHDGTLSRFHQATDRRVTVDDGTSVAVAVTAAEYATQATGPVVWTDPPPIDVWGTEQGSPMTAADARALARALVEAADQIDEVGQ